VKRWLTVATIALAALALSAPAAAAVRPSPEIGQFYNPFPYYYEPELVKVFSGITPGTTTLGEILEKRGKPKRVVNNYYLYYEWVDYPRGRRDFQEVYLEFRESRRLGNKRYSEEGLDLTAVVSRIFVYSTYRMERLATYIDQIADITLYPYEVYYSRARLTLSRSATRCAAASASAWAASTLSGWSGKSCRSGCDRKLQAPRTVLNQRKPFP